MKPTDTCFIMCDKPDCFPTHEMSEIAERVQICHTVRKTGVKVNWD